jgi:hypothetical protein
MQNLVISIENPLDIQLFANLTKRLGLKMRILTSIEEQLLARQNIVQLSQQNDNTETLDMEDIMSIVDEVRTERYQK